MTSLPPARWADFVASGELDDLTPQQVSMVKQKYMDKYGDALIADAAEQYGLDPDIYRRQIKQESGFKVDAVSPKGARGTNQFMPKTAREERVDVTDPDSSIYGGAKYTSKVGGTTPEGLASYNAGHGRIAQLKKQYGDRWLDYAPKETREYVENILGQPRARQVVQNPDGSLEEASAAEQALHRQLEQKTQSPGPVDPSQVTWQDFENSEDYQSLTPEQKAGVRQKFLEKYGAKTIGDVHEQRMPEKMPGFVGPPNPNIWNPIAPSRTWYEEILPVPVRGASQFLDMLANTGRVNPAQMQQDVALASGQMRPEEIVSPEQEAANRAAFVGPHPQPSMPWFPGLNLEAPPAQPLRPDEPGPLAPVVKPLQEAGRAFTEKRPEWFAMSKEAQESGTRRALTEGGASAVTSLLSMAPGFALGGVPGMAASGGAVFGLSEYQAADDEIKAFNAKNPQNPIPEDIAAQIRLIRSGSEAGFEFASDLIGGKILGLDKLSPITKETILRTALTPTVLKTLGRMGATTAVEVPSEMATSAAQSYADTLASPTPEQQQAADAATIKQIAQAPTSEAQSKIQRNVLPDFAAGKPGPWEAAKEAGPQAAVASLLLSGLGAGVANRHSRATLNALADAEAPEAQRTQAARAIAESINDAETRTAWAEAAADAITNKQAIPTDDRVGDFKKAATPPPGAQSGPQQAGPQAAPPPPEPDVDEEPFGPWEDVEKDPIYSRLSPKAKESLRKAWEKRNAARQAKAEAKAKEPQRAPDIEPEYRFSDPNAPQLTQQAAPEPILNNPVPPGPQTIEARLAEQFQQTGKKPSLSKISKDYKISMNEADDILRAMEKKGLFKKKQPQPAQEKPAQEEFTLGDDAPEDDTFTMGEGAQPADEGFTLDTPPQEPPPSRPIPLTEVVPPEQSEQLSVPPQPDTEKGERSTITPSDIHALAESKGIPSDNDEKFAAFTKQLTGKEHLDEMSPDELTQVKDAIEEGKRPNVHDFSTTQVDLPEEEARKVKALAATIPDEDLADDGREETPHVTVRYGIDNDDAEAVRKLLENEPPLSVNLGKTSVFPADQERNSDVVKIDVSSPDLERLNKKITEAIPGKEDTRPYSPHVTLAYVKPGLGKKYEGKTDLEGQTITVDKIAFNDRQGNSTEVPLAGQRSPAPLPTQEEPPPPDFPPFPAGASDQATETAADQQTDTAPDPLLAIAQDVANNRKPLISNKHRAAMREALGLETKIGGKAVKSLGDRALAAAYVNRLAPGGDAPPVEPRSRITDWKAFLEGQREKTAPSEQGKQPWEMKQKEFQDILLHRGEWDPQTLTDTTGKTKRSVNEFYRVAKLIGRPNMEFEHRLSEEALKQMHEMAVSTALARNQTVPPEVLAEYPDLQPQGQSHATTSATQNNSELPIPESVSQPEPPTQTPAPTLQPPAPVAGAQKSTAKGPPKLSTDRKRIEKDIDRIKKRQSYSYETLAEFFRPGRIYKGGYLNQYNKVLDFQPRTDNQSWKVTEITTDEQGNPLKDERPRTHFTQPDGRKEVLPFLQERLARIKAEQPNGTATRPDSRPLENPSPQVLPTTREGGDTGSDVERGTRADAGQEETRPVRPPGGVAKPAPEPRLSTIIKRMGGIQPPKGLTGETRMLRSTKEGSKLPPGVFRQEGNAFDDPAFLSQLEQAGFDMRTPDDLWAALEKEASGQPVYPTTGQKTVDAQEQRLQQEADERQASDRTALLTFARTHNLSNVHQVLEKALEDNNREVLGAIDTVGSEYLDDNLNPIPFPEAPRTEQTEAGTQNILPGTPVRQMPNTKIKAKGPDKGTAGLDLFEQDRVRHEMQQDKAQGSLLPQEQAPRAKSDVGATSKFADKSRDELQQLLQMYEDNMATRRAQRQAIPESWQQGVQEIRTLLGGGDPQSEIVTDAAYYGHPQNAETARDDYGLVPIRIDATTDFDWRLKQVAAARDELQTKIGKARSNQDKQSKQYLSSAAHTEDTARLEALKRTERYLFSLQKQQSQLAPQEPRTNLPQPTTQEAPNEEQQEMRSQESDAPAKERVLAEEETSTSGIPGTVKEEGVGYGASPTEGQSLFEKGAPYVEPRTRAEAVRQGQDVIDDLRQPASGVSSLAGNLSRSRSGVRTLAVGIADQLTRRGRIDLRGHQVNSVEDLATLARVYRDKRLETFRIFYTQNGKIIAHEGISSRLPDTVAVFTPGKTAQEIATIRRRISRLQQKNPQDGPVRYYLLHNHPGGKPTPSREDRALTTILAEKIPGFAGHVVLDFTDYGVIDAEGNSDVLPVPSEHLAAEGQDVLAVPAIPHDLVNGPLMSQVALARIGKRLQTPNEFVTLIYRSGQGTIRAIQEMPIALFRRTTDASNFIRGRVREFGAPQVFAYYGGTHSLHAAGNQLIRSGTLHDVVIGEEEGLRSISTVAEPQMRYGREEVSRYRVAEKPPSADTVPDDRGTIGLSEALVKKIRSLIDKAQSILARKQPLTGTDRRAMADVLGEQGKSLPQRAMDFVREFIRLATNMLASERGSISTKPITPGSESPSQTGIRAALKAAAGTARQQLEVDLGKERGDKAFNLFQHYRARAEVEQADLDKILARRLTNERTWNTLKRWAFGSDRLASELSTFLRNTNWGKRFGVAGDELTTLFRTVEAIKELDVNDEPVFGTKKFKKNPKTGEPLKDAAGNPIPDGDRYTAAEGQKLWDSLSPRGKEAALFWVRERETLKVEFGITSDLEGYIHHFWDRGFFRGLSSLIKRTALSRMKLRKKTASSRKVRMEATGFVEDFERAVAKGWGELIEERAWNEMMERFIPLVTDPIDPNVGVHDGWVEIPKSEATRRGKYIGQLAGGRQIPAALWNDMLRYVEPVLATVGAAQAVKRIGKEMLRESGKFMAGNLMIAPATMLRNIYGSGINYATYMLESAAHAMVTGNIRPFLFTATSIFESFRPSVWEQISPELLGSRSNLLTQFEKKGWSDHILKAFLFPIGMVDNSLKRMIAIAELRARNIPLDRKEILKNEQAFADMRRAVDTWGLDYENIPRGMRKFKEVAGSQFLVPFVTYPYKAAQMLGHYLVAIPALVSPGIRENLDVDSRFPVDPQSAFTPEWREITTRLITLGAALAAIGLVGDDEEEKTGPWREGMPYTWDKAGRLKTGETPDGKERYTFTADQPWFNLYALLRSGWRSATQGDPFLHEAGVVMEKSVPGGGLFWQGAVLAHDMMKGQYKNRPVGPTAARLVKPLVPFGRMTETIKETGIPVIAPKGPEPLTKSVNFTQEIAEVLPFPLPESVTGLREIVEDPATGKPIIKNPTLQQRKFWLGINSIDIDPKAYDKALEKMTDTAEKRLKKIVYPPTPDYRNYKRAQAMRKMNDAKTVGDLDNAFAEYKSLAPDKAAKFEARVDKRRIIIEQKQKQRLERVTKQAQQQAMP